MEGIPVRELMKIAHHLGRFNFEGQTQRLPQRTSDASCPVDKCAALACLCFKFHITVKLLRIKRWKVQEHHRRLAPPEIIQQSLRGNLTVLQEELA